MTPEERPGREEIEPEVDPDSAEREQEQLADAPHEATRFEAPDGQGTSQGPPYGQEFQERPVLDGSTQSAEAEATVPNPYRGRADPSRISQQPALNSVKTDRWLIGSSVAAVILVATLLVLAQWNPLWCGFGVVFALVALLALLGVRLTKIGRKARLRVDAVLMALLWIVPLAIIVSTLIGSRDEIWPNF